MQSLPDREAIRDKRKMPRERERERERKEGRLCLVREAINRIRLMRRHSNRIRGNANSLLNASVRRGKERLVAYRVGWPTAGSCEASEAPGETRDTFPEKSDALLRSFFEATVLISFAVDRRNGARATFPDATSRRDELFHESFSRSSRQSRGVPWKVDSERIVRGREGEARRCTGSSRARFMLVNVNVLSLFFLLSCKYSGLV
jgi:hypothetical protein